MGRFVLLVLLFVRFSPCLAAEFAFENGAKLVASGHDGPLKYVKPGAGRSRQLVEKHPELFPGRQGAFTDSMAIYAAGSKRVVIVGLERKLHVVTYTGQFVELPLEIEKLGGRQVLQRSPPEKGEKDGYEYIVLRCVYDNEPSAREYVIREDGNFTRVSSDGSSTPSERVDRALAIMERNHGKPQPFDKKDDSPSTQSTTADRPTASGEVTLQFDNGARVVEEGGVFYVKGGQKKRIRASQLVQPKVSANYGKLLCLESKELLVVRDNGKHVKVPANYARLERKEPDGYALKTASLKHKKKEYLLVSVSYSEEQKGGANGETFIFREDGQFFRVAYQFVDFEGSQKLSVVDGILNVEGLSRALDLDCFQGEARFHVGVPTVVEYDDGEVVADPLQLVMSRFMDLGESIRAGGEVIFPDVDESAIEQIRRILQKSESKNIALLGPSGTGKTQLLRTFVQGVVQGKYPEIPRTLRVPVIDSAGLSQGTRYAGTFETRVKAIAEACRRVPLLLFMDEIHGFRGLGAYEGNMNDLFTYWKGPLASGQMQLAGTSTVPEFENMIEGDEALDRRFTRVGLKAPRRRETVNRVRSWLVGHGHPRQSSAVLSRSVTYSSLFNPFGDQPFQATDLMDNAIAQNVLDGGTKILTLADLKKMAQKLYGVDPVHFSKRRRQKRLAQLPEMLERSVMGLSLVKQAAFQLIRQYYAKIHDPKKPAVRLLIVGPPGVGKTEIAKVLAKALKSFSVRIEMNRFARSGPQPFLYEVADALKKHPFAILVFDEFEKASYEVQEAMLALMDSGQFSIRKHINASSRGVANVTVNARHAMIIATSNAGSDSKFFREQEGVTVPFGFHEPETPFERLQQPLDIEEMAAFREVVIEGGISKAVFDRFQKVVPAFSPTKIDFSNVLALHLKRAARRVGKRLHRPVRLANPDDFVSVFADRHYQPGMSNRRAHDIIDTHFNNPMAERLIEGSFPEDVLLSFDSDTLDFSFGSCAASLVEN